MVYDRTASGFFGFNPSVLAAQDPAYARMLAAVTMAPGGTPLYQRMPGFQRDYSVFNSYDKAGDTGDQGEQLRRLLEKRAAYAAMSPADQMHARTTGDGYFNNADTIHMFDLLNNQSGAVSSAFNQLYGDQLRAGTEAILNNEGFSPNMKSWAALNQGNKTFSAMNVGNPLMRSQLPLGNQLGNIVNRWSFAGVNPGEMLNNFANTRDSIMDEVTPYGGWQLQGYGYNSQGMGGGPGSGGYTASEPTAEEWGRNNVASLGGQWGGPTLNDFMPSATYSDAYNGFGTGWGSGVGYKMGWMPSGTPFKNNSLLQTGGTGVNETGIVGRPTAFNPNNPYGGSWTGQWDSPGFTPPNYIRDMMYGGTSGAGGPLVFADPNQSGSQSTLNGMDSRYSPDWGNPIQNRGYAYGLTPNEQYNLELYQQQLNELMQAYQDQRLPIPPEILYQGGAGYFQGNGYGATEQPKFYLPEYSFENSASGAGTFYDTPGTRTYNGTPLPATTNDVFNQAYYDTSGARYTPQPSLATGYNTGMLDATYGYNPYQGYTGFAVGPSFDPTNYSLFY